MQLQPPGMAARGIPEMVGSTEMTGVWSWHIAATSSFHPAPPALLQIAVHAHATHMQMCTHLSETGSKMAGTDDVFNCHPTPFCACKTVWIPQLSQRLPVALRRGLSVKSPVEVLELHLWRPPSVLAPARTLAQDLLCPFLAFLGMPAPETELLNGAHMVCCSQDPLPKAGSTPQSLQKALDPCCPGRVTPPIQS